MQQGLIKVEEAPIQVRMSPQELTEAIAREKELRALIVGYYQSEMKPSYHYGKVPGSKKDSLWKPGALNLCSLFKVTPIPHMPVDTFDGEHLTVKFQVDLISNATGQVVAIGFGSCSTKEKKYNYGKAADHYNTVLKMAEKRALVDAAVKLPLVSELFTQDAEDEIHTPKAEAAPKPAKQDKPITGEQAKTLKALYGDLAKLGRYDAELTEAKAELKENFEVESVKELSFEQAASLIGMLEGQIKRCAAPITVSLKEKLTALLRDAVEKKIYSDRQIAWKLFKQDTGKEKFDDFNCGEAYKAIRKLEGMLAVVS